MDINVRNNYGSIDKPRRAAECTDCIALAIMDEAHSEAVPGIFT